MSYPIISFINGDSRMVYACDYLVSQGIEVCYFGFENYTGGATKCRSKKDTVMQADIAVFPINYPLEEITELQEYNRDCRFAAGIVGQSPEGIYNYLTNERLQILNAIPTAEGALMIAIRETNITVNRSEVLIIGFGRVGKAAAHLFKGAGAEVTVALRNEKDSAICELYGYKVCPIAKLSGVAANMNTIINTVPAKIIGPELLSLIPQTTLIIDLASKPGGIDFEYAEKTGKKVIWALSLPSTVAPKSAGILIAECIKDYAERTFII